MESAHFALWQRCRSFVGSACADRDASHGLGHMETVTESAVLLYLMSRTPEAPVDSASLSRIIMVGMLHDVADHKYDHDGKGMASVRAFVASECQTWASAAGSEETTVSHVLLTLEAVSYSKEKKRGMRWFASSLPSEWVEARDYVSDADKLDAIGTDGLMRCYEYTCHVFREKCQSSVSTTCAFASVSALETALLKDVVEHHGEKLCCLAGEFIVTPAGKFLAGPRHEAMGSLLAVWRAQRPPPVTLYWPDAARYCGGDDGTCVAVAT